MITTINEFRRINELASKSQLTGEWYHGDMQKCDFHNRKFDLSDNKTHKNSNGPGIYFTRFEWQARGYAEPDGYVYTATMNLDPKRTLLDNTRPDYNKLKKFIELGPDNDLLSNYAENPRLALPLAVKMNMESDNMLDAVMGAYNDLYQNDSVLFAKNMIEIGYDAFLHKLPEVDHLIVYNSKIINLVNEEKYVKNNL